MINEVARLGAFALHPARPCGSRPMREDGRMLTYKGLPVTVIMDTHLFPDDHAQRRVLLEFRKEDAKKIEAVKEDPIEGPWREPVQKAKAPRYWVTFRSLDKTGRDEDSLKEGAV